jgi:hypothetical protein
MKLQTSMNWNINPFKKKQVPEKKEIIVHPRDPSLEVVESYWIEEPLSRICVVALPGTKASYEYFVEEGLQQALLQSLERRTTDLVPTLRFTSRACGRWT